MKLINVYSHFGFYIKVYFQNRMKRDAFLFEIVHKFGITVREFDHLIDRQVQIQESLVLK